MPCDLAKYKRMSANKRSEAGCSLCLPEYVSYSSLDSTGVFTYGDPGQGHDEGVWDSVDQ